jgi:predicted kinase
MGRPGRRVVLVSGAPGAGKSTLAVPLAPELGFMLLRKDRIKETLHDALASGGPAVVLEANFRPHSDYERNRILALGGRVAEVNCVCSPELAARRFAERAATAHPVHVRTSLSPEQLAEYDCPMGIGEVITVDTTRPVDVAEVAAAVRSRFLNAADLA